jgi:hypothetical protein
MGADHFKAHLNSRQPFALLAEEEATTWQPSHPAENTSASCPLFGAMLSGDMRRYLYQRDHLPHILSLSSEQVDTLINTGQLTPILICGVERFPSREISQFVDTYIRVTRRRADDNR